MKYEKIIEAIKKISYEKISDEDKLYYIELLLNS